MSLISAVISDIRVEIHDTDLTRFVDDTTVILPLVKQAIRRANRICQRHKLNFAKVSLTFPTVVGLNYVNYPSDLDIPIGLWRTDTHGKITQIDEEVWETILTAPELKYWMLDTENGHIWLSGTPASITDLKFWYFPTVDPSVYTTAHTMPWAGRLDDIIARYVAMRIQNIEEANIQTDQGILQEMENSIIDNYAPMNPLSVPAKGWM
jgi:hypothetical protein